MKTIHSMLFATIVLCTLSSCGKSDNAMLQQQNNQETRAQQRRMQNANTQTDFAPLAEAEKAGILLMREEEKMAHDTYVSFYRKFGLRVFDNISNSEAKHTEAIGWLIEAHQLNDPLINDFGKFTNETIQQLFDKFIAESVTLTDALKTGAYIEEYDILDLQTLIAKTKNEDILRIYGNLLNGSENHLRAFVRNLAARGIHYQPQLLSEEEYLRITQ